MNVTLPQSAIDLLKKVLDKNKDKASTVRIYFAGVGCSGARFDLALDEQKENDVECKIEGLHFIMDKSEYEQYGDVTIIETQYGFMISVSNMPQGGGCEGCSGCH